MKVEGVDYVELTNHASLMDDFKIACKDAIANNIGYGIAANDVQVTLSPGTVIVDYAIKVPSCSAAPVTTALVSAIDSGVLGGALETALNNHAAINKVKTGAIVVADISTPKQAEAPGVSCELFLPLLLLVLVLLLACCCCCCYIVRHRKQKAPAKRKHRQTTLETTEDVPTTQDTRPEKKVLQAFAAEAKGAALSSGGALSSDEEWAAGPGPRIWHPPGPFWLGDAFNWLPQLPELQFTSSGIRYQPLPLLLEDSSLDSSRDGARQIFAPTPLPRQDASFAYAGGASSRPLLSTPSAIMRDTSFVGTEDALFNALDRNHDGVISRAEWSNGFNNQARSSSAASLQAPGPVGQSAGFQADPAMGSLVVACKDFAQGGIDIFRRGDTGTITKIDAYNFQVTWSRTRRDFVVRKDAWWTWFSFKPKGAGQDLMRFSEDTSEAESVEGAQTGVDWWGAVADSISALGADKDKEKKTIRRPMAASSEDEATVGQASRLPASNADPYFI
jgi:hypothetical protein